MECDLLIIGGGINGAGIARDASGRGFSVILCEKDDLASHTSSASTKLIHGGLRYLEYYEFSLVRKALIEREILLRAAPHIIRPLSFVMPQEAGQRPAWLIRMGLYLYDHLAKRELLSGSRSLSLPKHVAGGPLKPELTRGFSYSDGWVDDARLVVLNAVDAAERGAAVLTRTNCESVRRENDHWTATLRYADGRINTINARCLVNAAGPWATTFLQKIAPQISKKPLRLIKGSHIVVKKLFDHSYAYIFQHPDKRIVFAIPYEQDFTLIGTTDIEYHGAPEDVRISQEEIVYLCTLSNRYFRKSIAPSDVIWTYSGVRPLVEDAASNASAVTRDYQLCLDEEGPPLLSVFGGKITTFRKLAEDAVNKISPLLGKNTVPWTAHACLPGGDLLDKHPSNRSVIQFEEYIQLLQQRYPWLSPALLRRYAHAYGTRISSLLAEINSPDEMGIEILSGLYEAEIAYLRKTEWARTAEDILWRRSKLGLHLPTTAKMQLDIWLKAHPSQ